MKVALIFLSVMVAITHQQFQRQLLWRNYYPSYPSVNKYQRIFQNLPDDIQPEYYQFRPTRPITYSKDNEFNPDLVAAEYQDYSKEDEYPDVHSRVKVYNPRLPFFPIRQQQDQQQRFLISYVNNLMTKTLTLTSSLTLTSIQSCIAAAKFVDAAAKKTQCRRKRALLDSNNAEDTQFAIVPTETQKVMSTALPSLDVIRESRRADQSLHKDIITSSKDIRDISEPASWMRNLPVQPRFLNSFASTTVTTYSFKTETVTKTVVIGADAQILCLPTGWIIC
ncbi:uncharacterized protein LOC124316482 [Daphnia pulicaria]|uniref:uncharacterized protein LOC124316482 n=1 Tax=Daphnia pulicaria TaxID=35523 RepID=UPI001EEB283C|nr:uncharacterized protein LOC124316482 [Daphnia pulicaria]